MRKVIAVCLTLCLSAALALPASALEYTIDAPGDPDYGTPTSAEVIHTADSGALKNEDVSKNAALAPPSFGSPSADTPGTGTYLTPDLAPDGMAVGTITGGSLPIVFPPVSATPQGGAGSSGNTADPAMNSGNHVMLLGDTVIWMYESLAGIRAGEPGFKAIELFPVFPEGLNSVSASYDSPYGEIVSEWRLSSGRLLWDVEIPANTRATLRVPKKFDAELKGADPSDEDDEYLYYVLGSGRYRVR